MKRLDIYVNTAMYGGCSGKFNQIIMNTQQGILVLNKSSKAWVLINCYVFENGKITGDNYTKQLRLIDCSVLYLLENLEFKRAKIKL